VPGPYPLGFRNSVFTYKDSIQGRVNPAQEIPLTGAQKHSYQFHSVGHFGLSVGIEHADTGAFRSIVPDLII
jgi:hypothetical protein